MPSGAHMAATRRRCVRAPRCRISRSGPAAAWSTASAAMSPMAGQVSCRPPAAIPRSWSRSTLRPGSGAGLTDSSTASKAPPARSSCSDPMARAIPARQASTIPPCWPTSPGLRRLHLDQPHRNHRPRLAAALNQFAKSLNRFPSRPPQAFVAAGKVTTKQAPPSAGASCRTVAPWWPAIWRTSASPRPQPPAVSLRPAGR